jgi:uncharacterized HAD superfamily protein
MKEKLGMDLDGVIYPFVKAVETYCRITYGYAGTTDEFERNIDKYWKLYNLDWIVESPNIYQKFIPEKKMMALIQDLSSKYQIFYVTSRPESLLRITEKYLRDYDFPQRNNLVFTQDKDVFARLVGLTYFVEDNVENACKLAKACMSFLVKTPYNDGATGNFKVLESVYDLRGLLLS